MTYLRLYNRWYSKVVEKREEMENEHRDNDLPAEIRKDGTQKWFKDGKLHRDNDLPAIIWADGDQEWWVNGEQYNPHRDLQL